MPNPELQGSGARITSRLDCQVQPCLGNPLPTLVFYIIHSRWSTVQNAYHTAHVLSSVALKAEIWYATRVGEGLSECRHRA